MNTAAELLLLNNPPDNLAQLLLGIIAGGILYKILDD